MGRRATVKCCQRCRWDLLVVLLCFIAWLNPNAVTVHAQDASNGADQTRQKLEPVPETTTDGTQGWLPTGIRKFRDSVFRIDLYEDEKLIQANGTAFLVKANEKNAFLVTCSHVLNWKPVGATSKRHIHFKAVHPKSGATFDVVGGKFHPNYPRDFDYDSATGGCNPSAPVNDVAVFKINGPFNTQFPIPFEMSADDEFGELQGADVHLFGFPAFLPTESIKPFYSRGIVGQTDDQNRWLAYETTAGGGASGSPVFVLTTDQTGQRHAHVVGVHFSATCGVQGRINVARNLGYAVNIRQTKSILANAEGDEFDFKDGYWVEPPKPTFLVEKELRPVPDWPTFDEIQRLAHEGQRDAALDQLMDLIAMMKGEGCEIPPKYQLLYSRLLTDQSAQLVASWQPNDRKPVDGIQVASVRSSEEGLLNSTNLLRPLVDANEKDLGLNLMYIRAELEYARHQKSKPVDNDRLKWVAGRVNELLRRPGLRKEDVARCLFLRGLARLSMSDANRAIAREDFSDSFNRFASLQTEAWLRYLDGYRGEKSSRPDLWEGLGEEYPLGRIKCPAEATPVPQRKTAAR